MRKLLVCMLVMSSICIKAYADEEFMVGTENGKVEINGKWGSAAFLNIEIVPSEYDLEAADESIGEKCILLSVRTESDGVYNTVFEFPDNFSGGKYKAYISDGTEEQTNNLFYINYGEMQPIINNMNKSGLRLEDFKTLAIDNAEKFGVDKSEFMEYADEIIEPLYNARGEYTVDSYYKNCRCAVATEKLKNSDMPDKIIKENAVEFGIDYEKDYEVCSNSERSAFVSNYTVADILSGNYQYVFKKTLIGTRLQKCNNYTQYGDIILNYTDFLKINLTSYNNLTSTRKAMVLSKLYGKKIIDTDKIAAEFNACVSEAAQSSNQGSGGSGGSGGGKDRGDNTIPSVTINQDTPADENNKIALSDISGHWAASDIELLVNKGIVNGFPDGSFRPEDTVTRSQFIKMLAAANGLQAVNEVMFDDVALDNWNCGIITAAAKMGIVSGFEGKFMPDEAITRQDCAVIIYNSLKCSGITISGESSFDDKDEISDYAAEAVGALNGNRIINGYTADSRTIFKPYGTATRAEAVKMITNFIKFTGER